MNTSANPSVRVRKHTPGLPGLDPVKLQELFGFLFCLAGTGTLLAILTNDWRPELFGAAGAPLAEFMRFAFGKIVALLVPAIVVVTGVSLLRGYRLLHPYVFCFGLFILLLSLCGLLAHAAAQFTQSREAAFAWGGALGTFILHPQGGHLSTLLGPAGVYFALAGGLISGLMLTTNILFMPVLAKTAKLLAAAGTRGGGRLLRLLKLPALSAGRSGRGVTRCFGPGAAAEVRLLNQPLPPTAIEFDRVEGLGAEPVPEIISEQGDPQVEDELWEEDELEEELELSALARLTGKGSRAAAPAKRTAEAARDMKRMVQPEFDIFQDYMLPPIENLTRPPVNEERMSNKELMAMSAELEQSLGEFSISARVVKVTQGPTVTMFELQMAPGVKVSRITALENDIAMYLKAHSVRILAPVPGRGTVGIEVPNPKPSMVYIREILESEKFQNIQKPLAFALGKTVAGEPMVCDLAKMPHLLIAGATGSGKSVCLNSIICSLLIRQSPSRLKFLMIDPKKVELNVYQELPHLLAPVVSEPRKAAAALAWIVTEMEQRYERLKEIGERNIDSYNQVALGQKQLHSLAAQGKTKFDLVYMPHIIVVIDELADLMLMCKKEIEDNVARLAQMSRAVGIHLILATQRPSVNVITGIIKANFPTRIAFQVASQVDSKTILDTKGAESLLGQGDMLFLGSNHRKALRVQGCFVSDDEVEILTNFIRNQKCVQYIANDFETLDETDLEARANGEEVSYDSAGDERLDADWEHTGPGNFDPHLTIDDAANLDDERPRATPARASVATGNDAARQRPRPVSAPRATNADARPPLRGKNAPCAAEADAEPAADRPPAAPARASHYVVEDFEPINAADDELEDDLYHDALLLVLMTKKASVSLIQRKLKIGYARAGRLMDIMENKGIVGPYCGSKPRQFLVDPHEYLQQYKNGEVQ